MTKKNSPHPKRTPNRKEDASVKTSKPALALGATGAPVKALQGALRKFGHALPAAEFSRAQFGPGTQAAVQQFQATQGLPATGVVDPATQAAIAAPGAGIVAPVARLPIATGVGVPVAPAPVGTIGVPVTPVAPAGGGGGIQAPPIITTGGGGGIGVPPIGTTGGGAGAPNPSQVGGQLTMDYGSPAASVTVRLYGIAFGGAATQLAQASADANGVYAFAYTATVSGLEVRAVDPQGDEAVLSSVVYNPPTNLTLNLVVPASVKPLAPEYQRLSADMQTAIGGIQNLANAQETPARQDLTLLNQTTGWDARLLALAANAAQQATATGLGPDVLYALFRAGLPTDTPSLASIQPATVAAVLTKASQAGIVSLTAQQVTAAQASFTTLAATTNLALKVSGAPSTFSTLLGSVVTNPQQQTAFAQVFFNPAVADQDLWTQAAAAGIPAATISTLQLQGQLSYLTYNNAGLVQTLQTRLGSTTDPAALADADFHLDTTWTSAINSLAANTPGGVQALIPTTYGGNALEAYAADMARKVRVSFPTRVVARMATTGTLGLSATAGPAVGAFLQAADKAGYQLGRTPLNAFLRNLPPGTAAPDAPTTAAIKTIHRLYQITPSNESLQAAVKLGFSSARDVVAHTQEDFLAKFGPSFPSLQEATLVYQKSQQVSAVTLNLFAAAKQLDTQPALFALSAPAADRQQAKAAFAQQFPSMAGLFGSLDFCECQDCRSILSPAAYFVDLLHFLDPDPAVWLSTTTFWATSHNGEAYPFGTPFAALTARRPDLPNLNLSCENTNTALPYIDVVNEILEYFVAFQATGGLKTMAYDTGSASSADLVAEPQNILPAAYAILANYAPATPATYPLNLPFDLATETVRGFLGYFNLQLWQILDVFRPADSLELLTDATVPPLPYHRAAIFLESLGLAPAESALLTSAGNAAQWFSLYGYASQATALSALTSAATLADTLDITYQNLADIMETGFLNPALVALTAPLEKFGLSLRDVFTYTAQPGFSTPAQAAADKAAFEANLQAQMAQDYPKADPQALQAWLTSFLAAGYSNQVLVLQAPAEGTCDFQHTIFQYAGGNPAAGLDFLRLNLFVRIWKKLGWTIDEVDRALQVFLTPLLPAAADPNLGADLSKAMTTALIYLAHFQTLSGLLQAGPFGRIGVLPVWSPVIPTAGENPLYAQLFLTDAVLNNDPIFDSPVAQYLCYLDTTLGYQPFRWAPAQTAEDPVNGYVLLGNHVTALQGALGLTADDVQAILADNGLDIASAPLTQASVSLLYRYGVLANGLGLSVDDFIALKQMAVDQENAVPLAPFNPFDPLPATPLSVLRDDRPWGETLQFAKQAAQVQASGFSVPDLQYLLCHVVVDPAGPYAPDPAVLLQRVRALSAVIATIQGQTAVPTDPTAFGDDVIRQKLSQAFPANVVQTFMGMWTGTLQYTATPVPAPSAVPAAVFSDQPAIQLVYDDVLDTQTLVLQGVLTDALMATLTAELATLVTQTTITAAQQTLLQGLLNDVHAQALGFFQANLQQATVGNQTSGFLQAGDFDALFSAPTGTPAARLALAGELLPFLRSQLVGQAILQAQVAQLGADPSFTRTLLTDTAVLSDPTQAPAPPTPLLAGFEVAADRGVTVTYYSGTAENAGTAVGTAQVATASTTQATNPAKPSPVNSAHFEGYLEVPADGPYRFTALLPNAAATATLQFDFLTAPLPLAAGAPAGGVYPYSGYTQFKAGLPCHFTLDVQGLAGGDAQLQVQGESLPAGPLGQLVLYPQASVERFNRAQVLLAKAWQLIGGFQLDEDEVIYLLSNPADFGNLSLNALPTQASDHTVAGAQALFGQFLRLANYAALRNGPAGGTDGLIAVFSNARQVIPLAPLPPGWTALQVTSQNLFQAIANVTRRDIPTIQSVIAQLWGPGAIQTANVGVPPTQFQFTAAPLVNDLGFARLWAALQMVQTIGIRPAVLQQTTGIVSSARATTSPDPGIAIASTLRNAVKSQFTPDAWQPVAQSVFDPLRQRKRDSLCAYLLTLAPLVQFGAQDTNGLFEYFLVDPGMEPVVQTSRIRLALSSVQTFIQRCLLNLEPQVRPSVIDSGIWEWMKRYRVWEANREIFLWPENWLIPEFRENATDLFQALQGALLQGNITSDVVEQAFTQYLQNLDGRARLDIVSLFNEQPALGDPSTTGTLHVVGRNYSKPKKYFYRTFANGVWAGWIPLTVDIDGDHVVAVVWRQRLHVFWLTFVVQGSAPTTPNATSNADGTSGASKLTDLTLTDLSNSLQYGGKANRSAQVQLNWSEYYQGKWSARKSSDINRFEPVPVDDGFNPVPDVYVHASIETDADGNETAVRIHMDGALNQAFRLTGKNSDPVCSASYWAASRWTTPWPLTIYPTQEYDATKNMVSLADGAAPWSSSFLSFNAVAQFTASNQVVQSTTGSATQILQGTNAFNLLLADNLAPWTGLSTAPTALYDAYLAQIAALGTPFFFEDAPDGNTNQELTFFVQPTVTETSVTRYRGWAVRPLLQNQAANAPGFLNGLVFTAQVPNYAAPISTGLQSVFKIQPIVDSTINETTVVGLGTATIGRTGGVAATQSPVLANLGASLTGRPILSGLGGRLGGIVKAGAGQLLT